MKYDYLVVGSGLFGSTFANLAKKDNKRVLVIEKRDHIGGNIYTENIEGIIVHKYGAHIFHTDYEDVWEYVKSFVNMNRYAHQPIARIDNEVYNLPFNMNTFSKIWNDVVTPEDAIKHINDEKEEINIEPTNLEEQAISLVGRTIYEKLIKGYTEKQWNKDCKDLPAFIIKRLPVRLVYDNNYFNDKYQGIPIEGYTKLIESMLEGIEVRLNTDFFEDKDNYLKLAKKVVYTGPIDQYFDYQYGKLEWRSLRFENEILDVQNYQGNAVVNYTGLEVPYTRVIEHKHFENANSDKTIITYEYPMDYVEGMERFYPINNDENEILANQYKNLVDQENKVIFGGRLAEYKYYDMDDVIKSAFNIYEKEKKNKQI